MSGIHIALAKAKKRIAELEELCEHYYAVHCRMHDYLANFYETQGWPMQFDYMEFQRYIEGEEE